MKILRNWCSPFGSMCLRTGLRG